MTVEGKRIIVTGAASGIGAETAKLLTERGANIIALDRNEVSENCEHFIQIDLSNEASIANAANQIGGTVDALCNIAGVPPTLPPIPVLQVNFVGLRMFTELCIPKLNHGASVVNVSSLAGINWQASMENSKALFDIHSMEDIPAFVKAYNITEENCYEFSKEALTVWTMQSWNRWKEQGIRVNAISPSATKTPILGDFMETVAARLKAKSKPIEGLPGPGAPEDIAHIIAFLCSDDSRWLNGTNIVADGGLFAARAGQRFGF